MANLLDEIAPEELRRLAKQVRDRLAKQGARCIWCDNYNQYAEPNYTKEGVKVFLCWACNCYMTRVILGLE